MKRGFILRFVCIAIAAALTVYFAACKKEIITPINNKISPISADDQIYTSEARKIVRTIKNFKSQVVDKEFLTKGDSYIPIDSVIWNVEALFNASYTFPERKYEETVKQDLEFFVAVNEHEEALMSVVSELYESVITAVRQAYANDGINTDKSLLAVDVEKGDSYGGNVGIIVHVISGKTADNAAFNNPAEGPFGPGDCWYFGEYGGTCEDPSVFGDAAEIIEDSINYYFRGTIVPNSGYRCLNHSMVRIVLDGNEYVDANGDFYAYFYCLNDNTPYYLDYNMLNSYYYRELALILNIVPSDPVFQGLWPSDPAFLEVDIMGLLGMVGNQSCAYHRNIITYCCKTIIPEQELGPVRDLLN